MLTRHKYRKRSEANMVFKLLKWLVILVVVLVVVAVGAAYVLIDHACKTIVEKEGTAQLHVPTTVGSVSLGLISGSVGIKNFALGSPVGFTAPQMFSVGGLTVKTTGTRHLLDKPLHVTEILVDSPTMVVEQKGTQLNFKAMMDGLPSGGTSSPATADQNPTRLVIDTLTINTPVVTIQPDPAGTVSGLAGGGKGALGAVMKAASGAADKELANKLKPMTVQLQSLTLKNIGNADGKMKGVEIKDVATAVIQAMVAEAAKQHNLPLDPALLSGNLDSVKSKLGGGAGQMLNGLLGGNKGGN
jgi:hypothetical protein